MDDMTDLRDVTLVSSDAKLVLLDVVERTSSPQSKHGQHMTQSGESHSARTL